MKARVFFVLGLLTVAGCSGDDAPTTPADPKEVVSTPTPPVGQASAVGNETIVYRSGGASSSLGHPIEYRFDSDAGGNHDYSAWSSTDSIAKTWSVGGVRVVEVQARCQIHPNITSPLSDRLDVTIRFVPATEIVALVNRYIVGGIEFSDTLDTTDAVADTVPFASWVTLFYRGLNSGVDTSICNDFINKCYRYQMRYERESVFVQGVFRSTWLPFDPVDTNTDGVLDSMSMKVGSGEYTIFARAVDLLDVPDPVPPSVNVIGNFDPTLDGFTITNYDGQVISDGDTIRWDFWNPANTDTIDVVAGDRKKVFYFVVSAGAHDHPKERDGEGVKSWFYEFPRVGDPSTKEFLGKAGTWFDAPTVNILSDTVRVVFRYPILDGLGDDIFINNPPSWNGHSYDFTLRGRDLGVFEQFEEVVIFDNTQNIQNRFFTGEFARRTGELGMRFHLILSR